MLKQALSLSLLTLTLLVSAAPSFAENKVVAGKVVAVSEEKITANGKTFDQVTVSVEACDANGALKTVIYSPITISDRSALGHLFDQNLHSDRTANMPKQHQTNGFGMFWVDDKSIVHRTGILGSQVDCAMVPQLGSQFK